MKGPRAGRAASPLCVKTTHDPAPPARARASNPSPRVIRAGGGGSLLSSTPAAGPPELHHRLSLPSREVGDNQGRKRCSFPKRDGERQSAGGMGGRPSPAMRKAPGPARRGPCRKVWLARQPLHLGRSGRHPEGRGEGSPRPPPPPPPPPPRMQTRGAGAAARRPCKPRAAPTRAPGSPWAAPHQHRARVRSALRLSRGAWHRCRAKGRGDDRQEGGAGGPGSTYIRQESASSRGREGKASRRRKRPRDAPGGVPPLPARPLSRLQAALHPAAAHPTRNSGAQTPPPRGLPRGPAAVPPPAARATGGSVGLQRRRAPGTRRTGGAAGQAPRTAHSPRGP